jgi:hypothetical protein
MDKLRDEVVPDLPVPPLKQYNFFSSSFKRSRKYRGGKIGQQQGTLCVFGTMAVHKEGTPEVGFTPSRCITYVLGTRAI